MLRFIFLLAIFGFFWGSDLGSFYGIVIENGIEHELNPIVVAAYDIHPLYPVALKLASLAVVTFVTGSLYVAGHRKTAYAILMIGIVAGVIGTWSNGGFG